MRYRAPSLIVVVLLAIALSASAVLINARDDIQKSKSPQTLVTLSLSSDKIRPRAPVRGYDRAFSVALVSHLTGYSGSAFSGVIIDPKLYAVSEAGYPGLITGSYQWSYSDQRQADPIQNALSDFSRNRWAASGSGGRSRGRVSHFPTGFSAPLVGISSGAINGRRGLTGGLVTGRTESFGTPLLGGLDASAAGQRAKMNEVERGLQATKSIAQLLRAGSGANSPASQVSPVPLPAAFPLFAGGLGVMGVVSWRRKRGSRAT